MDIVIVKLVFFFCNYIFREEILLIDFLLKENSWNETLLTLTLMGLTRTNNFEDNL